MDTFQLLLRECSYLLHVPICVSMMKKRGFERLEAMAVEVVAHVDGSTHIVFDKLFCCLGNCIV